MSADVSDRRYAGRRITGFLRFLVVCIGLLGLIGGPIYWINGMTQPAVTVQVPLSGPATPHLDRALADGVRLETPDPVPAQLTVWEPGTTAKLLWRSDVLLSGLLTGIGALMLFNIVSDIGEARPFSRRTPRRLGLIALLVVVGGIGSQFADRAATHAAVSAAKLSGAGSPIGPGPAIDLFPIIAGLAVLTLAEAFRVGARLRQDTEGLV